MSKKKIDLIAQRKQRYESNRRYILENGILTEDEYNNLWLDSGTGFLSFAPWKLNYASPNYFQHLADDRSYWQWWLLKWQEREMDVLQTYKTSLGLVDVEMYKLMMQGIWIDQHVLSNFSHNYLKILQPLNK